MLEYKHLVSLKTIRECDSLNGASKVLNLSLSALSHQIKDLENYYECSLFIRKSKPIQFTSAGKQILELSDKVIPLFQDVMRNLNEYAGKKPTFFNIALECHSCYHWLLPTITEFRTLWPEIDVDLSAEFNFHPLPKLLTKELDIVITGDPNFSLDVEYYPLFDFELLIGVSPNNPLAKKKYLVPADIEKKTIIAYPVEKERLSIFNRFMMPAGIAPVKIRAVELTIMIIELAAIDRGICCLPNWAYNEFETTHSPIKKLKLGKEGIYETLYIAFRKENKNFDYIRDFIRLAKITSQRKLKGIRLHKEPQKK